MKIGKAYWFDKINCGVLESLTDTDAYFKPLINKRYTELDGLIGFGISTAKKFEEV